MKKIDPNGHSLLDTLHLLLDWGEDDVLMEAPIDRTRVKPAVVKAPNPAVDSYVEIAQQVKSRDAQLIEKISKADARRKAEELAYNANSLEELRKALDSFDGCDLKFTAIQTVFSDGNSKGKVMLVGEAPGADEDRLGKPFVGQSGQLLDKFLGWAGFSREKNVYIANTVPWRPPGNRQPTTEEIFVCLPFLERHIELIAPSALIMLGGTALKTLHKPKEGIVALRGKWMPYTTSNQDFSVDSMAVFHPAFLLRSPGQKKMFWRDMLTLQLKARDLGADV